METKKIEEGISFYNKLSPSQIISVALLLLLLITVPIGVFSVVTPKSLFYPRAKGLNSVNWRTDTVFLESSDFSMKVDGVTYQDRNDTLSIRSNSGNLTYTTLEAVWYENNREMRMDIHFAADADEWWVYQIRTYDGQSPGDWIYYIGEFFRTPFDSVYTGDVILSTAKNSPHKGMIRFQGLELQAFLNR